MPAHKPLPPQNDIQKFLKCPIYITPPLPRDQRTLLPTPFNNRPSRIPRPNDHILILLQANQPPATTPHTHPTSHPPSHHPPHNSFPPLPVARKNDSHACARTHDEGEGEE